MHKTGKREIVVFDVEGVLIPKNRYLLFELGGNLGLKRFLKIAFIGVLYELGLLPLKSALNKVFKNFKGLRKEHLLKVFRATPLMAEAEEVFEKLKNKGFKTVLISSGLPNFVVEDLALKLKADYAFGVELETVNDVLTGEVSGLATEPNGKLEVLKKVLEKEGLNFEKCVVVADDRNNAPMMVPKVLKIGFNPDFLIRFKADHVVAGSLTEVLPLITKENVEKHVWPSRNELVREAIHACGFTVPILSSLTGKWTVAILIATVTLIYAASELAMMKDKSLPLVSQIVRHAASHTELHEFAFAPIFFALGILLSLLLYPPEPGSAAIAIFALQDSAAAIFGKIIGKTEMPFNKGKTFEGSIAGFFFGLLAATCFTDFWKALAGAAAAMIVESLPLPLNDNLTVPLTVGAVLTLAV